MDRHTHIPCGYNIQVAAPVHIQFLNGIELAAAKIFTPGSIPEHIFSECLPEVTLVEAMKAGNLWVATDASGYTVGYGLLQLAHGLALLAQMDVHPDHGRKGIGTALVLHIAAAVRNRGIEALYLTTFAHIPWNAPFYAKLGFAIISETEQPSAIREILLEELSKGLENRTAMRLPLAPH